MHKENESELQSPCGFSWKVLSIKGFFNFKFFEKLYVGEIIYVIENVVWATKYLKNFVCFIHNS